VSARPPRNALRRFTLVRHHDASMASFRPALTETPQRIAKPHWGRPVNSGPRPCLIDVGFPLSGLQVRTHTSDLNVRAQHTRLVPTELAYVEPHAQGLRPIQGWGILMIESEEKTVIRGRQVRLTSQGPANTSPDLAACGVWSELARCVCAVAASPLGHGVRVR
jgi:hypothetical protein